MTGREYDDQATQRIELPPSDPEGQSARLGWQLVVSGDTHVGQVRERNEDALHVAPTDSPEARARGWFGAVADGLGGRQAGDVASRLAVEAARETFYADGPADPAERLRAAVVEANRVVYREARCRPEQAGMGSTMTAAAIYGGRLHVAQVGDSRAYLVQDDRIRPITRDHSWVADSVRAGLLTREAARTHPRRNLVTRVLGEADEVKVDLYDEDLQPGDVVVLCSDGLHGLVDDEQIGATVGQGPCRAVRELIELANRAGGIDNVSVIVAWLAPAPDAGPLPPQGAIQRAPRTDQPRPEAAPPRARRLSLPAVVGLAAALTFVLVLAAEQVLVGRSEPDQPRPPTAAAPISTAPTAVATPAGFPTPIVAAPIASPAPGAAPPTPAAPSGSPSASPAAAERIAARFHPSRPARLRTGPATGAQQIEELAPENTRRRDPTIVVAVRGERPAALDYPEDRTNVWYQIIWDTPPGRTAFVHCSAIQLADPTLASCTPPESFFRP